MDKRIGVDAFQGTGCRQQQGINARILAHASSCGQTENGPHSFSADKEAVAHPLYMTGKLSLFRQHVLMQSLLYDLSLLCKVVFDINHFYSS